MSNEGRKLAATMASLVATGGRKGEDGPYGSNYVHLLFEDPYEESGKRVMPFEVTYFRGEGNKTEYAGPIRRCISMDGDADVEEVKLALREHSRDGTLPYLPPAVLFDNLFDHHEEDERLKELYQL